MKRLLALLLLAGLVTAGDLHFPADRPFDLLHLRLDGRVDLRAKTFTATAGLAMRALRETPVIVLDAVGLEVSGVRLQRGNPLQPQEARWTNTGETLEIALLQAARRGEGVALEVDYVCRDPELGLAFRGPDEAEPEVAWQVWSQGQTLGTRHWLPVFDHPGERLTSEMRITVDEGLQVLSNGVLASRTTQDGTETWHWKQETDHAPYLLSLVVGTFAVARETWRGIPVETWVPPDRAADAPRSFANTPRMLDFFSDFFGVDYPWAKYTQVVVEQFSYGGMENTSATTLNERTLHDERAHLDVSSDGLVAHELAHQWFGDLVTCREWAHTWLNEGFATYGEALWCEHDEGSDAFAFNMLGKLRGALGAPALPVVHGAYDGPWQQFDGRTYSKGAWILHMLRRRLGDEAFRRGLRRYLERFAHDCVETEDFRRVLEAETGVALGRFFHDWTERPGHPVVEVRHAWHGKDGLAEVRVVQKQKEEAFIFPLRVQFACGETTRTLERPIDGKDVRFFVPLPSRPDLVRVDPDNAVLMALSEVKGRDLWIAQLTRDPNPVARIRAAEHLGGTRRDDDRRALAEALGNEPFWAVQAEVVRALGSSGGPVARDTLLQALSLEHPKARRAAVEALGGFREDAAVEQALRAIVVHGDASYHVEAAAIEAWAKLRRDDARAVLEPLLKRDSHNEILREAILRALGAQRDPAVVALLAAWTGVGRPRTCRVAALEALGPAVGADAQALPVAVDAARACLVGRQSRRIKMAAVRLLRDLGEAGAPALDALEALADHDEDDGVRREAKAAVERIRSGAPASEELQRLREELRRLREEDARLRERLERLEGKGS